MQIISSVKYKNSHKSVSLIIPIPKVTRTAHWTSILNNIVFLEVHRSRTEKAVEYFQHNVMNYDYLNVTFKIYFELLLTLYISMF